MSINLIDITKGHVNELFGLNQSISEGRLKICYDCPLFLDKFEGICNSKLFMNKKGDVSVNKKDGYEPGCGCRLQAKTRLPGSVCPHNKW